MTAPRAAALARALRLAGALLAAGCGGAGGPSVPDAVLLPVGVDPAAEADRVAAGLARAGYAVVGRRTGDGWAAVALADGERSAVRVTTRLGVRVALDAGPGDTFDRLALFEPPAGRDDLDGDGRPEIVLEARDRRFDRRCLRLLRVLDTGRVAGVPVPAALAPGEVCLVGLVPGPAGVSPFAVAHLPDLARAAVPFVEVPLGFRGGALVPAAPGPARAFWDRAAGARREALAAARAALDVETFYRLAVELAVLERLRGAAGEATARAFEARFADLVLTPSRRASVDDARRALAALEVAPAGPRAGVPGAPGPATRVGSDGGGEGQEEEGGADDGDR